MACGQNLVPNPSFEEYLECPYSTAEFHTQVLDWYSFAVTPDYFHSCSNDLEAYAGVPANAWGFQWPITGEAYAGFITYSYNINEREYMACPLIENLEIGEEYYVMFYVSLIDGGDIDYWHCASDHFGAKFFIDPEYTPEVSDNPYLPENSADIEYNEMITDTDNWKLIDGWFTAVQEYNWLALGNFYDDDHSDTMQLGYWEGCLAIYYVENVCVAKNPEDCDYLKQESDVNSVDEPNDPENSILVFPNPSSGLFQVESSSPLTAIRVYNPIGQLILNKKVGGQRSTINGTIWSKGLYIIEVEDEGGNHQIFKLIRQ